MVPDWLRESIDLYGGLVDPADLPKGLTATDHDLWSNTVMQVGEHFHALLEKYAPGIGGAVAMTRSPSFGCRVRRADEYLVVMMPLGVPARLRVMARLLLRYWGKERRMRLIASPLDDLPVVVPPHLEPLLTERQDVDAFFATLAELDRTIELDPKFAPDVSELVHCAMVFLLAHEFAHVLHGHHAVLEQPSKQDDPLSRSDLLRGLELDADDGAAAISMLVMHRDIGIAKALGADVRHDRGWLRLSYAVSMLFAMMDTHKRSFNDYRSGTYNHPMVRCELFFEAVERALNVPEPDRDLWRRTSMQGWIRCVRALDELSFDAIRGMFGEAPRNAEFGPLHTLLYSATPMGPTDRETLRLCHEANALRRRVRERLPIYTARRSLPDALQPSPSSHDEG